MGEDIHPLAVHIPFSDTLFEYFVVMAIKNSELQDNKSRTGRILWDTSFHHLVDINWVSDGKVPWEHFTPFSVQGLWRQQLPPSLFENRLNSGVKRLIVNAISWLAHELMASPDQQLAEYNVRTGGGCSDRQKGMLL